jgi:TonB family protein
MDLSVSVRLRSFRLPSWICFSIAAHLLLVSPWGKGLVSKFPPPYRPVVMTADISYVKSASAIMTAAPPGAEISEVASAKADRQLTRPNTAAELIRTQQAKRVEVARKVTPGDAYLAMDQVDVRAEPINEVLLHYPSTAYIQRISGVVQFKLYISAAGDLDRAELVDAKPSGVFEQAAWNAVKQLKFSPARKYGQPIKSEKTIDVVFEPYVELQQPAR